MSTPPATWENTVPTIDLEALYAAPTAHRELAIPAPAPPPPADSQQVSYHDYVACGIEASRASLWAAVLAQRSVRLAEQAKELKLQMQAEAVSPWTGRPS